MNISSLDERCIWMAAGLVVYKLCDRDHDCALCPFDRAMRGEYDDRDKDESPFFSMEFFDFYHPNHLWVRVENPSKVILGIDNFLCSLISNVKSIVFPNIGDRFSQDETICHIVEERGILALPSPISGVVLSLNGSLKKRPDLLVKDPLKAGFLLKMRPDNFQRDIKKLLSGKQALAWLKRDEKKLFDLLFSMTQNEAPGPTMQDGGARMLPAIISELSEKDYLKLIEAFLVKP